jgi:hypothetical protein
LAPWRVGSLRGIGQLQSVLGAQSRCQCCNGDRHLLYPTPVQGFSKMFRQRGVAGFVWPGQYPANVTVHSAMPREPLTATSNRPANRSAICGRGSAGRYTARCPRRLCRRSVG